MSIEMNCPCGSGRKFAACHGAATPPPMIVQPTQTLKLDLAAGQNVREGFEGVDVWPGSKHVVDLMKYPWPWADNSVDELHCSHFIEHIPMIYVDRDGHEVPMGSPGAQDALFRFFDECWRILKPDAWMTVIVPCARNDRAFQDPTHRRFVVAQTFLYLVKEWRDLNKLNHYNVVCDFGAVVNPLSVRADLQSRAPEVAQYKFSHEWNTIEDWIAKLQKKPAQATPAPAQATPMQGVSFTSRLIS